MFVRVNQRTVNGGQPKEIWFVLETDHPSLEAIHEAMIRDGRLFGVRYDTRPDGPGRRVITDDMEISILADSATSVLEMTDDLIEDDGTVIFSMDGGAEE